MKNVVYGISLFASILVSTSCECTRAECIDTPSLYIDIESNLTGESQLFGMNASLDVSDVNVFAQEGNEMVSFPKVRFKNPSISPDSFLLVILGPLTSNTIFLSIDPNIIDTIDLFISVIPESSCCDMGQELDSISVKGVVYFPSDGPLVFFR
jgi:hypothetical protein